MLPQITATGRSPAPVWAVRQRDLMSRMDGAAGRFVDQATRPDGSLIQRTVWTSMDGTDNGYEAFLSFPLFYLLGGNDYVHEVGRKEFDAITRQYAEYGTVDREFVTGFDWFHGSESYTYLYYLAMCDPTQHLDRARALRFAAMYMGQDRLAPNWDADQRQMRGPLNGSHGPRFVTTQTDWDYHRPILANYLSPFEDMIGSDMLGSDMPGSDIPGSDASGPDRDPMFKVDWTDDATFDQLLERINSRMTRGDVPINLSATSLITNAYLHTGDAKYRDWVLAYLQRWMELRDRNGGLMPDNVGPSGEIGELNDGNWWGGYYGWRWPHGARNIVEPALVAGSCALLMTGDFSWLDLARSQLDRLWEQRKTIDGVIMVPARHGGQGWFDYRLPDPYLYIHLHYLSQQAEDRKRLETVFPERSSFADWPEDWGAGKAGICPPKPWFLHMEGNNDRYMDGVFESTARSIHHALDRLEADDSDPETRECYHFQNMNPVVPEALLQMAMGTPAAIYNGGLLQAHLSYFDPDRSRPGLPPDVAARVASVSADEAAVELVNLDAVHARTVGLGAGCFGEHQFTHAEYEGRTQEIQAPALQLHLGPGSTTSLRLGMRRFANTPSYAIPTC
jgi:hypothetical protein